MPLRYLLGVTLRHMDTDGRRPELLTTQIAPWKDRWNTWDGALHGITIASLCRTHATTTIRRAIHGTATPLRADPSLVTIISSSGASITTIPIVTIVVCALTAPKVHLKAVWQEGSPTIWAW